MKFGVIIFPGSNCDRDAFWTVENVLKQQATFLWHESHDLQNVDAIIVPGGFAFRRLPADRSHREVFAGHGVGAKICRPGWTGDWDLQRISDSVRGRPLAGRANAQLRVEICVQAGERAS